ncbi:MAG TPA: AAA family ATPase [Rhizomicrobium sp.]|nr:AAA family ATPase [Rhizomicrobium sp.]
MQRYILTGTPGAGKTALLRALEARGYCVVEEAATDVIALEHARGVDEPWRDPGFVDKIVALQVARRARAAGPLQIHDRSTVCALVLARWLGFAPPPRLEAELARIAAEGTYERQVFFIRNLGRIENTAARRISYEDALAFEALHEEVYRELGFRLVEIAPAPVEARADAVEAYLRLLTGT